MGEERARLTAMSRLLPNAPFPYGMRKEEQDRQIFGDKSTFREIKMEAKDNDNENSFNAYSEIRKPGFRFESLATEFEHMDENDSGIDSEDVSTVSPGSTASLSAVSPASTSSLSPTSSFHSSPEQREPLSLVIRDMKNNEHLDSSTPRTPKHWKKSISRNYSGEENQENGPLSPITSTTAEALLSLGKTVPQPRLLPIPVAPSRPVTHPRIVQPWATPASSNRHNPSDQTSVSGQLHSSTPVTLRKGPSDISNVPPLFPSHPLPPIHFQTQSHTSVPFLSLPQQPAPLKEVQSNLQLSTKPPFSVTSLSKLQSPASWHQPVATSSPTPLFQHSIFTCENIEDGSSAGDKPFHCHECKKSFSTQSGFAKHQQLHCSNQIQRDFTCKYCNKAYNSLSALKMHIRTHTLPCKCPDCGKSFSRPWLLQGHMRTHTGEKPFACTHCARTFADKSNLRAHLQTHLQNKKYSCPGCQKTFSRMSLLNKHTDSGCVGLQTRNEECVETLIGLSSGLMRS